MNAENHQCPLCGASNQCSFLCADGRKYTECTECGLIFLHGRFIPPREKELERYRLHENSGKETGFLEYLERFIDFAVKPFVASGTRILDYGSGPEPVLATMLSARGYAVSLYDPYFGPFEVVGGNFDACVIHETIEHFPNPREELEKICGLVRDEGCIAIRTLFRPEKNDQFKAWWYRQDVTHKIFFSMETFKYIAASSDFEIIGTNGRDMVVFKKKGHHSRCP